METRNAETAQWAQAPCTAFLDSHRVASGALRQVVSAVKQVVDADQKASVLIFDDATGATVEVDLRGSDDDVLKRLTPDTTGQEAPPGPGRPRLGVVAREVTLLPRHWDWLNRQPGGASVALRKLVEEARRTHKDRDLIRQSQEAAYRFLSVMAGDRPGFEEAARALFTGDEKQFNTMILTWPADIQEYARRLADVALHGPPGGGAA
ncbi:MAG: DUF2239 family protein [Armatimonadetes bacterium]|nr:DUF2239 family protein [Armatimonadota bacterium]